MKAKTRIKLEIILMLCLCLVLTEWAMYRNFTQYQIYVAFGICLLGLAVSKITAMSNFFWYYLSATIATPLVPVFWLIVTGQLSTFWDKVRAGMIPFAEFSVSFYIVVGIGIFFVIYVANRVPQLLKKA